jgi:hypothetical protein
MEGTPATDMEEICQIMEVDCSDLPEPIVVVTQHMPGGLLGAYYRGEPYIFVYTYLPLDKIQQVIYHETVHYVSVYNDWNITRCASEELARSLTATRFNEPESTTWRENYGC